MKALAARISIASLLLLSATSCGSGSREPLSTPALETACTPGQAQIAVGDGFQKNLCGCSEAGGTQAFAGTSLTCTVPAGTTVFFHYMATLLAHQIIPVGTPAMPASPVSDP